MTVAADRGFFPSVIQSLAEFAADVNACDDRRRPWTIALANDDPDMVKALLPARADPQLECATKAPT